MNLTCNDEKTKSWKFSCRKLSGRNKKNCESAEIKLNFQLIVSRTMQDPTEGLPALKSDLHFFEIVWQRWSCFKFEIDKKGPFWV